MSDTTHRGRVVMMMMTNRPDKLDADPERPGRFDLQDSILLSRRRRDPGGILEASARRTRSIRGRSGSSRCSGEDGGYARR